MKKIAMLFAVLGLTASFAYAAAAPAPAECEGLRVATGEHKKGYAKLYANIVTVCGDEVKMCEVVTTGGLDNLDTMARKDADVGLAQLDTALTVKRGSEFVAAMQAMGGLNFNYMHVVTAIKGFRVAGPKKFGGFVDGDVHTVVIDRFSALKGQRVVAVGSAQLLASQLNNQFGYNMILVDAKDDPTAFKMVQSGQVAAALTVSGWPNGTLSTLDATSGLTLVPFDATIAAPYVLRPLNYKSMGVHNNQALAVPNLLFTRPFTGEKAQEVAKLKQCIARNLPKLQEGRFEPGWNEIKSLENTYDWPKFVAPASQVAAAARAKKK
jgi:TRAP-type uncharacterized transport system substrate-binding protein